MEFDESGNVSALDYFWCRRMAHIKYYVDKVNDLLEVRKLISNWQEAILFRAGVKKAFVMRLRNGRSIKIGNPADYFDFWTYGKWDRLKPKNRTVVDVGAWDGDTAIYFATKGAKHVYAYEPYPYSYRIAKKNIGKRGLLKKITLLNEGCGTSGSIKINSNYQNTIHSTLKNFKNGKTIKIRSLAEVCERYKLKDCLLKIDCEGHEYELLLGAPVKVLRRFERIILGYHHGYKNLIFKFQESGFNVVYTRPVYSKKTGICTGLMFAERVESSADASAKPTHKKVQKFLYTLST